MSREDIVELQDRLRAFARCRDWEQFHSPKNLSMALIAECAELVEHFQWLTEQQSGALPAQEWRAVRLELADVFIYLLRLADQLGVDLLAAAREKIDINEERYPSERVRGDARRAAQYALSHCATPAQAAAAAPTGGGREADS